MREVGGSPGLRLQSVWERRVNQSALAWLRLCVFRRTYGHLRNNAFVSLALSHSVEGQTPRALKILPRGESWLCHARPTREVPTVL